MTKEETQSIKPETQQQTLSRRDAYDNWSSEAPWESYAGCSQNDVAEDAFNAGWHANTRLAELEKLNQELVRVIKFAVAIDDHFEMRDFLNSWLHGDISEWPEFNNKKE